MSRAAKAALAVNSAPRPYALAWPDNPVTFSAQPGSLALGNLVFDVAHEEAAFG
jgi:hypothetical protein